MTSRDRRTGTDATRSHTTTVCVPTYSPTIVVEDHGDDFLEIGVELVKRLTLTMGARKAGI